MRSFVSTFSGRAKTKTSNKNGCEIEDDAHAPAPPMFHSFGKTEALSTRSFNSTVTGQAKKQTPNKNGYVNKDEIDAPAPQMVHRFGKKHVLLSEKILRNLVQLF